MTSTSTQTTDSATSADGTLITYEVSGGGPALVVVDGAMCQRAMGPSRGIAAQLRDRFTVYAYDRRGRGGSGAGNSAWSVDRELDDLAAVLEAAGAGAHLFGSSSGAVLALEAAHRGMTAGRLVAYEAPFVLDDTHAANHPELPEQVQAMVSEGRRSEAVKTFLRVVGAPAPMIALMPLTPPWRLMTGSHTPSLTTCRSWWGASRGSPFLRVPTTGCCHRPWSSPVERARHTCVTPKPPSLQPCPGRGSRPCRAKPT